MKEWLELLAAASVAFFLLGELIENKGAGKTARFVMGTVYLVLVASSAARLLGGT